MEMRIKIKLNPISLKTRRALTRRPRKFLPPGGGAPRRQEFFNNKTPGVSL